MNDKKSLRMNIDPSYYSITTAEVLYCDDLNDAEILLYTVVSGLAKREGYCWATNDQLAELRNKSAVSISRQVKHIERLGFFRIEYDYYGKIVTERRIFPLTNVAVIKNDNRTTVNKNDDCAVIKNDDCANVKNDKDNSNIIINKNINIGCIYCVWNKYPNKNGKKNSFKYIPKLIKKYGIDKINTAIDRYIEDVDIQRKNGFKSLGYKNGSTFFNTGIYDYLDDNYIKPVLDSEIVIDKKKINVKTGDFNFKPKIENDPELKKVEGLDFMEIVKSKRLNK
ncbi:MAG: hypothetical protein WBA74_10330 [Cyclobacteriaceae bacterium]